jgi:hypothetical protein
MLPLLLLLLLLGCWTLNPVHNQLLNLAGVRAGSGGHCCSSPLC